MKIKSRYHEISKHLILFDILAHIYKYSVSKCFTKYDKITWNLSYSVVNINTSLLLDVTAQSIKKSQFNFAIEILFNHYCKQPCSSHYLYDFSNKINVYFVVSFFLYF